MPAPSSETVVAAIKKIAACSFRYGTANRASAYLDRESANLAVRTRKHKVVSCSVAADTNKPIPSKIVSPLSPTKPVRELPDFDLDLREMPYQRKPTKLTLRLT
jgi:hypothetical protein